MRNVARSNKPTPGNTPTLYLHSIYTSTLITLHIFYLMPVYPHNSLHPYVTGSLALSLPPFPIFPPFIFCTLLWFPELCYFNSPSLPQPTNSSCHHQRVFSRHWAQSLGIPQDKLYYTLDMHVSGLKHIPRCLTIAWWEINSDDSVSSVSPSLLQVHHVLLQMIHYFKLLLLCNYLPNKMNASCEPLFTALILVLVGKAHRYGAARIKNGALPVNVSHFIKDGLWMCHR